MSLHRRRPLRRDPIYGRRCQAANGSESVMRDGQRQGVALALLAVLVGAIVQVTQGTEPFSLWQSMVGLLMIVTAHAYDKEIAAHWSAEAVAFAMIVAAGIVFATGFLVDKALLAMGIVQWSDATREKFVSPPGYISFNLQDDLFFVIWLLLTGAVLWIRHKRAASGPQPPRRTR